MLELNHMRRVSVLFGSVAHLETAIRTAELIARCQGASTRRRVSMSLGYLAASVLLLLTALPPLEGRPFPIAVLTASGSPGHAGGIELAVACLILASIFSVSALLVLVGLVRA